MKNKNFISNKLIKKLHHENETILGEIFDDILLTQLVKVLGLMREYGRFTPSYERQSGLARCVVLDILRPTIVNLLDKVINQNLIEKVNLTIVDIEQNNVNNYYKRNFIYDCNQKMICVIHDKINDFATEFAKKDAKEIYEKGVELHLKNKKEII